MKSFKRIFNSFIVITGLFAGVSLTGMQQASKAEITATVTPAEEPEWLTVNKKAGLKISSPLRILISNKTGAPVNTFQQGQGTSWWANIPNNAVFPDTTFNLDPYTKDHPQYTIRTANKAYILNFEKNPSYFKAILERLRVGPGALNSLNYLQLHQLLNAIKTEPVTELDKIIPSNTLKIELTPNNAELSLEQ